MFSIPFLKKEKKEEVDMTFSAYPHLKEIKPNESYVFHSDYFQIDNHYACVLAFFHTSAAQDNFGSFWGINRIPSGLDESVVTINLEQVKRMGEDWIVSHQSKAEGVSQMNESSSWEAGTNATRNKARKAMDDLEIISQELNNGASYLNVHNRMLVKAPTLEILDASINKIERLYTDRFATLWAAPYIGEQRMELSNLFSRNAKKRGKGFYYTSTEFAGSYSLVTHGMEDAGGEYVGYMVGDVNNSAVLFDVNNFKHHVVICSEQINESRNRAYVSDMWGSKLSQSALLSDARVVHIVLSGANLMQLGPRMDSITKEINLDKGDINMFEMFGDVEDELSIFPFHMQKLILMAEQAYETTDSDRSIIRGELESIATKFYIDNRMWYENAKQNRDRLRIVGISHTEVPKLEMFVSYLETEYKAILNQQNQDAERLHALSVLRATFRNLLSNNGDLFNTYTNPVVDEARYGRRVIYNVSRLLRRGYGVAMAQLVNVIAFATNHLSEGDLVVIHGAEHIKDKRVANYITTQLEHLYQKGARVAYLYNDFDKMLDAKDFHHFDKANYTVFGNMTDNVVTRYQELLGQVIPRDLVQLITNQSDAVGYIRRGFDNVVFYQDLILDVLEKKGAKR